MGAYFWIDLGREDLSEEVMLDRDPVKIWRNEAGEDLCENLTGREKRKRKAPKVGKIWQIGGIEGSLEMLVENSRKSERTSLCSVLQATVRILEFIILSAEKPLESFKKEKAMLIRLTCCHGPLETGTYLYDVSKLNTSMWLGFLVAEDTFLSHFPW